MTEDTTEVLVIGAGLAGLACAGDLRATGRTVRLLDKGRSAGGRASTRRWDGVRVDHGAQFFTARGERLRGLVDAWQNEGWLRIWSHGFPLWESGVVEERAPGHPRYAPPDGMSALPKHLAGGLTVHTEALVKHLQRGTDNLWTAICADGRRFSAARLVLNLPPPQLVPLARLLVNTVPLEAVVFEPAWTLLLRLERDLDAGWPGLEVRHPVLSWVSRDHTKRDGDVPPTLVAHAQGAWSAAHLEDDPESIKDGLLTALADVVGPTPFQDAHVHRWRYATPTTPFPHTHHWDSGLRMGWCGDWCGGARIEGALESGWALAAAMEQNDADA